MAEFIEWQCLIGGHWYSAGTSGLQEHERVGRMRKGVRKWEHSRIEGSNSISLIGERGHAGMQGGGKRRWKEAKFKILYYFIIFT